MPILRLKEIRDMSSDDRLDRLNELRTELVRLRTMIRAGGTVENPGRVKELRKAIARIMTIEAEQKVKQAGEEEEEKEEKKEKKRPKKETKKEKKKEKEKEE